jgi:hydroxymethylpyrimidine/phosphomethylpyrimidine kinase
LLAEVVESFELLELLEKVVAEVEEVVAEVLAEVEEVVAEVLEVLKEVLKEVLAEVLEEMYVKTCKRGNVFEMHPISTVNSMVFSALWCTRR